jgi:6-pyruvoyltetrahydropterin/6-carboxytetrahydropterin synthase
MVVDFRDLKRMAKAVLSRLDHKYLNELKYFKRHNPTSENIAAYIAEEIKKRLPKSLNLKEVRVWETETNCAIWP